MFLGQFFVIVNLIVPRILAQIDPNFEFLIFETSSIQIYKKNLRIRSSLDICVRSNLVVINIILNSNILKIIFVISSSFHLGWLSGRDDNC